MFEGISARTAALFGVLAGMALSVAIGLRPNMQLDMKVNFQPPQPDQESIDSANKLEVSPVLTPLENQPPTPENCPACGMG